MNTITNLTQTIYIRLTKFKLLIVIIGLLCAVLFFLYAHNIKAEYSSKATIFPLNTQSENSLPSSLSSLLGMGGEQSKSFGNDVAINIIELALSRNLRESVAATKLSQWENKTVAEVLVLEKEKEKSFLSPKTPTLLDNSQLIIEGGAILKPNIDAKVNKNGVLELSFTSKNEALVKPITEIIIDKISQFYTNLKRQKALADYAFIEKRIDSLQNIVHNYDRKAIAMENTTLFTPERLEYTIPKENLINDQGILKAQRNTAMNNRDEALWRLQKATPIIATLDKPDPPFAVIKPSSVIWSFFGFLIGSFITTILVLWKNLYQYIKSEIHQSIFNTN